MNRRQERWAMNAFTEWRKQGVPSVVTAHEAWKLSDGIAGKENDHGTPIPLAKVAQQVAKVRA